MSDSNAGPGGFGPPAQPPQQPAPGYGYPQSTPGYGYPQSGTPSYPATPPGAYPQQAGYAMPMQPRNGMGTAGLVLGIIGVVFNVIIIAWFVGLVLGILAIIFGAVGRGRANRGEATNKGAATAGLVLGIIATVILPAIILAFVASVAGGLAGMS